MRRKVVCRQKLLCADGWQSGELCQMHRKADGFFPFFARQLPAEVMLIAHNAGKVRGELAPHEAGREALGRQIGRVPEPKLAFFLHMDELNCPPFGRKLDLVKKVASSFEWYFYGDLYRQGSIASDADREHEVAAHSVG